jgi:hypothetical protein
MPTQRQIEHLQSMEVKKLPALDKKFGSVPPMVQAYEDIEETYNLHTKTFGNCKAFAT